MLTETVVYEVEILDIIERIELFFEQGVFKYPIIKPKKSEKDVPHDRDHITIDVVVKQKLG